jgi:uncharacterized protein YfiM (DUF2279 family)
MSLAHLLTPEELQALAEMFKKLAAMGVMALSGSTHAADTWGQDHVKYHLAGEAVIAATVTAATDSRLAGVGVALAAGVYREEWKRRHGYSSYSSSRIAADVAGSLIGAQLGHCAVYVQTVSCMWSF